MDKRLRLPIAIATVALVAGLVLLLAGAGNDDSPDPRISAAIGELDARIRETSAGAQARAVTLSQLPRLGWAVSTDPTTVRDLTQDELAFRPLPGESIEIAQIPLKGGDALTLLRAPAGDKMKLPITETGQRLLVQEDHLYVAASLAIHAHARAEEIRGAVVVAQRLELPAVAKQLESARAHVKIETADGAVMLGSGAPPKQARAAVIALGSPAAQAAKVTVLRPGGGSGGGGGIAGILVIVLGLAASAMVWIRGRRPPRAPTPIMVEGFSPTTTLPAGTTTGDLLRSTAPVPATVAAPPPAAPPPPPARGARAPTLAPGGAPPPPPLVGPSPKPSAAIPPPIARAPTPPVGSAAGRAAADRRPTPVVPDLAPKPPSLPPSLPLPGGSRPPPARRTTPHIAAVGAEAPGSDRRATPLVPLPTLEASGKNPLPDFKPTAPAAGPSTKVLTDAEITATDGPVAAGATASAAPVAVIVDEVSTTLTSLNADLARVTEHDRSSLGAKGANSPPEFRALFKEFVELRRTCGEPTDGLDADKFVVVLGQKRTELIARHGYKDVRFWVGFNDGKAVIRSRGIR